MIKRRSTTTGATVDLIPMIDVVFQLILFFLVSTTFAVLPAISVKLPSSQTSEGAALDSITIIMEENGNLWFNETKVSSEELESALNSFDTGEIPRNEFPIMLEADEMVTNGKIVNLFDSIRKAGFSAVNLRTTTK